MKKIICLIIALCLVFGSFSFAFAAVQDVSDSTTHTRLQTIITWLNSYAPTFNLVNNIANQLTASVGGYNYSVARWAAECANYLYSIDQTLSSTLSSGSGSGIAAILDSILSEMTWSNAAGSAIHAIRDLRDYVYTIRTSTSNIKTNTDTLNTYINDIKTEILSSFPTTVQKLTSIDSTLNNTYTLENNTLPGIYAYSGSIDTTTTAMNALQQVQLPKLEDLKLALTRYYTPSTFNASARLFNAHQSLVGNDGSYTLYRYFSGDTSVNTYSFNWSNGSPLGNIALITSQLLRTSASAALDSLKGFNSQQTWYSVGDNMNPHNFTPASAIDGVYTYLRYIQSSTARLAFVLADDDDIQMKRDAKNNTEVLADNFIDSTGGGAVPTSSFGSVSSLSSGVKTNITTDASPTGIFDIFNSDHGSWFSQETADQLDTTTRTRRGSSFDTPLLDQQMNDIYDSLGVEHD